MGRLSAERAEGIAIGRRAGLEEAAAIAQKHADEWIRLKETAAGRYNSAGGTARAIRALAAAPEGKEA